MAREAGYQIPAITINAINIQTIETHMTNLPQVASVASVKVTSAITILIHIIKAGMEASANSSNPSPSNCQRILPRLLPMAMRKAISLRRWRVRNQKVPISPMNTLKTKNITMSLALRIYGVYSFGSIPLYLLVLIALYVEKIEWSDLQLRHHILIKTGCKIIRIRLRTYP